MWSREMWKSICDRVDSMWDLQWLVPWLVFWYQAQGELCNLLLRLCFLGAEATIFVFFCRFHNCALHTWYAFVLLSSFQSLLDFEFSILIPNETMTQLVFCVVYIGLEAGLAFTLQWKHVSDNYSNTYIPRFIIQCLPGSGYSLVKLRSHSQCHNLFCVYNLIKMDISWWTYFITPHITTAKVWPDKLPTKVWQVMWPGATGNRPEGAPMVGMWPQLQSQQP